MTDLDLNENQESISQNSKWNVVNKNNTDFQVHINKDLIKSDSSSLPEELQSLGVKCFNENDFEKGVLLQVDLKIAEYELEQAKKDIIVHGDLTKDKLKRKSDQISTSTDEKLFQKQTALESKLKSYNLYLSGNSVEDSSDSNSGLDEKIKSGKITPFASILDKKFDSKISKKKISENKTVANTSSNDFDLFLLGLDKQKSDSIIKNKKKIQEIKAKNLADQLKKKEESKNYRVTDKTDFDLFLSDLDQKPKIKNTKINLKKPRLSDKVEKKKSSLNDSLIEEQLAECDRFFDEFNSCNKIKKTQFNLEDLLPKVENEQKVDKISFMKLIEDSDNEDVAREDLDLNEIKKTQRNIKDKIGTSKEHNTFSYEELDFDDKTKDPNYDELSDQSETSSVEYDTEDESPLKVFHRIKKKKRLKKSCMDDGDEEAYLERLAKLEQYETYAKKSEENEDFDFDDELKEDTVFDNKIVINNGKDFELDKGLRVPKQIWKKLFEFQKTGIKWLWELHLLKCGGILGKYYYF